MKSDENYIIIATDQEIWAINPKTKQRMRIKPVKDISKILDIETTQSGIYHAIETFGIKKKITGEYKEGIKKIKTYSSFKFNYIQIIDSISGNSIMTINPEESKDQPLEKRLIDLKIQFKRDINNLGYKLNFTEGIIFPYYENFRDGEKNLKFKKIMFILKIKKLQTSKII